MQKSLYYDLRDAKCLQLEVAEILEKYDDWTFLITQT